MEYVRVKALDVLFQGCPDLLLSLRFGGLHEH